MEVSPLSTLPTHSSWEEETSEVVRTTHTLTITNTQLQTDTALLWGEKRGSSLKGARIHSQ